MNAWLIAVCGAGCGLGLLVFASAWSTPPVGGRRRIDTGDLQHVLLQAVGGLLCGVLALVVTGWLVAFVGGAAGGWFAIGSWLRRGLGKRQEQARIEALATWCEQVRDLMSAEHGVLGTIRATVATCPEALRPEVSRLATRLERQDASIAMAQFADEVDDPSGDLVANTLLEAMARSGRTAELLTELASLTRDRASMRLRVESERAGQRAEARFVIGFTALVVVLVAIFGRGTSFLDAYDGADGELMLALIAAMFAAGIVWMHRLTRFERPARVISVPRERRRADW